MALRRKIRILFTGGGTGGHIYPLIAVKKALDEWAEVNKFDARVRYFGDPKIFRHQLIEGGMRISKVISSKWRSYFSLLNVLDILKFFIGVVQAFWKIFWFMPNVAFSKGGPGTLPIVLACIFYRIPLVIHESDAVPGFSNSFAAKYAHHIDIAFPKAAEYFLKYADKISVVGQPVRDFVLKATDQRTVKLEFGFDPEKPLIVVLGGSQGAQRINDFILDSLEEMLKKFQILHQVGFANYKSYKAQYEFVGKDWPQEKKSNYYFIPFFEDNISDAYDSADLVISRAGSGTIFELAAKGKPAILIPLPESARHHQETNAYSYAETGAALVIEEENILLHVMLTAIDGIILNEEKKKKMANAAKAFYKPESAKWITSDIVRAIR